MGSGPRVWFGFGRLGGVFGGPIVAVSAKGWRGFCELLGKFSLRLPESRVRNPLENLYSDAVEEEITQLSELFEEKRISDR